MDEIEIGRCTGSSSCRACKNCKYCQYCNNGDSCGVCSGGSNSKSNLIENYFRTRTNSSPTSSGSIKNYSPYYSKNITDDGNSYNSERNHYFPNDPYSQYYLKTLMVNTETLNLRSGSGIKYAVLEELNKYQELIFLAIRGE